MSEILCQSCGEPMDDPLLLPGMFVHKNNVECVYALRQRVAGLTTERDQARLEAAALRSAAEQVRIGDWGQVKLSHAIHNLRRVLEDTPGPGREFGERVKRLEAVYEAIEHYLQVRTYGGRASADAALEAVERAVLAVPKNTEAGD